MLYFGKRSRGENRPGAGEVGMACILWEYKILNIRSENYQLDPKYEPQLNNLGADGWELVGITAINFKTGATDHIGMVFKRPREVSGS
jgi:hypothetical protein